MEIFDFFLLAMSIKFHVYGMWDKNVFLYFFSLEFSMFNSFLRVLSFSSFSHFFFFSFVVLVRIFH